MNRMTVPHKDYHCRVNECEAEEWMERITGFSIYGWKSDENICDNCPFEAYVNRLAEFEDEFDKKEKFRKSL